MDVWQYSSWRNYETLPGSHHNRTTDGKQGQQNTRTKKRSEAILLYAGSGAPRALPTAITNHWGHPAELHSRRQRSFSLPCWHINKCSRLAAPVCSTGRHPRYTPNRESQELRRSGLGYVEEYVTALLRGLRAAPPWVCVGSALRYIRSGQNG